MGKKNELSLLAQAQENTKVISDNLENAVSIHAGTTSLETKKDSDGNEYISATFKLSAPTKNRSEIIVNDVSVAQALERMKKQIALGEVATFAFCKEIANFADTDAVKLGFDTTTDLAQAIFNLGKSTIGNYRRIGKYFISDDLTLRGAIPQETSISLLNQLLSFVLKEDENGHADIRNVECLFKYGILTPYMKQKDYKKILSALKSMETEKELKDMDTIEVDLFKQELENKLSPKTEDKPQDKTEDSNDPQVIIGQSMSMIKTIEDNFKKLTLTEEQTTLVATWLDNLYTTLGDMLG